MTIELSFGVEKKADCPTLCLNLVRFHRRKIRNPCLGEWMDVLTKTGAGKAEKILLVNFAPKV